MRPEAATLRLAVFPRSSLLTDVLLILGGAGFVALAAQVSISLPFTPVPITGQTFAVVLVGASLGSLLAVASLGVYIVGFVLAAALTGFLARERWDRRFSSAVAAMLSGNVVIYLVGLPWLAAKIDTGLEDTLEAGLYPFVVGDLLKLYLAGALLPAAWALVRRFKG
jgi:biotin transport system substrate-specific component